ncbi:MAG: DUF4253 domain-containing protein [Planctomycetota bacterium]
MGLEEKLRKILPKLPPLKRIKRAGGDDAWEFEILAKTHADTWMALWKGRHALGFYPLLGAKSRYDEDGSMQEIYRKNPYSAVLRRGLRLKAAAWLAERASEEDREETLRDPAYHGPWPSGKSPQTEFSNKSIHVASIQDLKNVCVQLLPVTESWEAMAYHYWGGWNDAPDPEAQVCMLKSWHDRFGAALVSDGGDFIELYCERPPETKKDALSLAKEMFTYCLDSVDQGYGTIEKMAHGILGSHCWFFWWD